VLESIEEVRAVEDFDGLTRADRDWCGVAAAPAGV
jgi:hypothetical protein